MPDLDEAEQISRSFEQKCRFSQVVGCIDGSHIPITAPDEGNAILSTGKDMHRWFYKA